jgi:hypothetical protein
MVELCLHSSIHLYSVKFNLPLHFSIMSLEATNDMTDKQTCEVGTTLTPHNSWSQNDDLHRILENL